MATLVNFRLSWKQDSNYYNEIKNHMLIKKTIIRVGAHRETNSVLGDDLKGI